MPVAGLVRLRKHQFGRQSVFGTKVAATRAYPFKGTPDGRAQLDRPRHRHRIARCHRGTPPRGPRHHGGPDGSVHAVQRPAAQAGRLLRRQRQSRRSREPPQSWAFAPASTTVDDLDLMTYEFGDDVQTDWFQLGDGILESWEVTGPEGLGPLTDSQTWRFGSAASTGSTDSPVTGTVPTAGLDVAIDDAVIYLKDIGIYIASSVAGLSAGQITDALHTFVLRFSGDIDQKRYANADQAFDVDAFARASRAIELECSWAKTDDIVGTGSEADAWFSDDAVNRYVQITATSTVMADGATPYSWTFTMPMRYYTRAEAESGGNTMVVLTGHAFYDPTTPQGVFTSTVVNTLTDAELGTIAS